jgi:hypothetical protein
MGVPNCCRWCGAVGSTDGGSVPAPGLCHLNGGVGARVSERIKKRGWWNVPVSTWKGAASTLSLFSRSHFRPHSPSLPAPEGTPPERSTVRRCCTHAPVPPLSLSSAQTPFLPRSLSQIQDPTKKARGPLSLRPPLRSARSAIGNATSGLACHSHALRGPTRGLGISPAVPHPPGDPPARRSSSFARTSCPPYV